MPPVCRLGLATRGGSQIRRDEVELALERGLNYWNWCGHSDGLGAAIAALGKRRSEVVVAVQFQAQSVREAAREFEGMLEELSTDYIDILTMYYVESQGEWDDLTGTGGVWEYLDSQKRTGCLRMIGVTSHQRRLAADWACTGRLDMLMVRYNAAHRGAETEVFPIAAEHGIPVVTFTGLRWGALLRSTPDDPPGFVPPTAAECYEFCLANPAVSVALAAPGNRPELDHLLTVIDGWKPPEPDRLEELRLHGARVRRHAGMFP
jgi:predicted aldo/keto reductase-like oxidoreductase